MNINDNLKLCFGGEELIFANNVMKLAKECGKEGCLIKDIYNGTGALGVVPVSSAIEVLQTLSLAGYIYADDDKIYYLTDEVSEASFINEYAADKPTRVYVKEIIEESRGKSIHELEDLIEERVNDPYIDIHKAVVKAALLTGVITTSYVHGKPIVRQVNYNENNKKNKRF